MMMVACGQKTVVEKTQSEQLMERLQLLQQKGYMFGHQDDPFYGLTWEYVADSSDVKNVCGDWPAVMGFELGGIEMGMPRTWIAYLSRRCVRKSSSTMNVAVS